VVNPWVPKKMLIPSGRLHRTEALYPETELTKTEFYADFLRPNDLFNGFGISLFNDRRFGFLSIVRSRHSGPPSDDELRLLELLTPHMQRAIQLHERFRVPPPHAEPALAVVEQLARGVIFLGQDRRSRYNNAAASRILSDADGMFLDAKGCCRTSRAAEQATLDRLIDGEIAGRRRPEEAAPASGGAMMASRPSARRPYGLVVAPLAPRFGLGDDHVAAVILISDPDSEPTVRRDLLRSLYHLSEKEAQLAIRLSAGERLEAVADDIGITYQSARTYLKAVFAKLGVNRQAELASVIQRLGG
jgi:DNA-binding CsgD family transcriptional regulator